MTPTEEGSGPLEWPETIGGLEYDVPTFPGVSSVQLHSHVFLTVHLPHTL